MGRTQRNDRHDRADKLAEAHDRLAAAVEALVTGDDSAELPDHGGQAPRLRNW
jgi:hypothetical protein